VLRGCVPGVVACRCVAQVSVLILPKLALELSRLGRSRFCWSRRGHGSPTAGAAVSAALSLCCAVPAVESPATR